MKYSRWIVTVHLYWAHWPHSPPPPSRSTRYITNIKAQSRAQAFAQAKKNKRYLAVTDWKDRRDWKIVLKARRTQANPKFWREVWRRALAKMPEKWQNIYVTEFVPLKTVPEYIKASALTPDKLSTLPDGRKAVAKKVVVTRVKVGQQAELFRRLSCVTRGRPRDPKVRAKLLAIAGMEEEII